MNAASEVSTSRRACHEQPAVCLQRAAFGQTLKSTSTSRPDTIALGPDAIALGQLVLMIIIIVFIIIIALRQNFCDLINTVGTQWNEQSHKN